MSHANYLFLVDCELVDDASKMDEKAVVAEFAKMDIKDIFDNVLGQFSVWQDARCDENNWARPNALVTCDGRIYEPSEEKWLKWPQDDKVWEKAVNLAIACVFSELAAAGFHGYPVEKFKRSGWSLGGDGDEIDDPGELTSSPERVYSQKDIQRMAYFELPQFLAKSLNDNVSMHGPCNSHDTFDMKMYHIEKLAKAFFALKEAIVFPFTHSSSVNPYNYRAFDLRESYNILTPDTAILMVDIHT